MVPFRQNRSKVEANVKKDQIFELKAKGDFEEWSKTVLADSLVKDANFWNFVKRYIFDPSAGKQLRDFVQAGQNVAKVRSHLNPQALDVPYFWSWIAPFSSAGRAHIALANIKHLEEKVRVGPELLRIPFRYWFVPVGGGAFALYSYIAPAIRSTIATLFPQYHEQEWWSSIALSSAVGGIVGLLSGGFYNLLHHSEEERQKKLFKNLLIGSLTGAGIGAALGSIFYEDKPRD